MESQVEKPKKIWLCIVPNCTPKQQNWYLDGTLRYGCDSSSAMEKHILNTHIVPENPQLKGKTVADAKKEYPNLDGFLKNSYVSVSSNDERVSAKSQPKPLSLNMLSNNNNVSQRDSPISSPSGSQFDIDDLEDEQIVFYANQQTPSQTPQSLPLNLQTLEDFPKDAAMEIAQSIDFTPANEPNKKRQMESPPQKFQEDELVQSFTHLKVDTLEVRHIIQTPPPQRVCPDNDLISQTIYDLLNKGPASASDMRSAHNKKHGTKETAKPFNQKLTAMNGLGLIKKVELSEPPKWGWI